MQVKCALCKSEFSIRPNRYSETVCCSMKCAAIHRKMRGETGKKMTFEEDENGCFICTSHKKGKRGYPRMTKGPVFRHVYEEMFGELPKGTIVRHLCDNKMCINPEHLRKGTQKENIEDALRNKKFPIGSQRSYAKYNELQMYGVKILLKHTGLTNTEIEKITSVDRETIYAVKNNKMWKHVDVNDESTKQLN